MASLPHANKYVNVRRNVNSVKRRNPASRQRARVQKARPWIIGLCVALVLLVGFLALAGHF